MKKIFIYAYNLEIGGIERSLIGLLNSIDKSKYEVDLFLARQEGELLKDLPKDINLLPVDKYYLSTCIPLSEAIKKGYYFGVFCRLYAKITNKLLRIFKNNKNISLEGFIYHKMLVAKMKNQKKHYDIALSFCVPYYYVLTKVESDIKVGWIHTDYEVIDIRSKHTKKMFEDIDYIATVSDSVGLSLLKKFNISKSKLITIENILSEDYIKKQADEFLVENEIIKSEGVTNILSIGRFCEAKNFDNIPDICKKIINKGCNIRWYIIGFGGDEDLIKDKIKEFNMEKYVIILGKKSNPYPYIKSCDIYCQPSRYEGKAVTVREAQILGKPVIISDFKTSKNQVKDKIDGIISKMNNEDIANTICELIKNEEIQNELINNCKSSDFGNEDEVNKIYNLINNI